MGRTVTNSIKNLVQGLALRFGYRISRIPTEMSAGTDAPSDTGPTYPTSRRVSPSAPWTIELVGNSGVGKSTFLAYLADTKDGTESFHLENDVPVLDPVRLPDRMTEQTMLLQQVYSAELTRFARNNQERTVALFAELSCLIAGFSQDISRYAIHPLGETPMKAPIVIDHLLVHFQFARLHSLHQNNPARFATLMHHRAVAICSAPPTISAMRIEQRSHQGVTYPLHEGRSYEELCEIASEGNQHWALSGKWLESAGVPVLRLDLGEPLSQSKDRMSAFARSLT